MMRDNREYGFLCSRCGCERLEEILTNAVAHSTIKSIRVLGSQSYEYPDLEYDPEPVLKDGEISRFQCANCGNILQLKDGEDAGKEDLIEACDIYLKTACAGE